MKPLRMAASMFQKFVKTFRGDPNKIEIKKTTEIAAQINALEVRPPNDRLIAPITGVITLSAAATSCL